MKTGCKQTATFSPNVPIPPDADALAIARTWLADFDKGIAAGDTAAISALFVHDGFWRDILALTHDFRTAHTAGGIAALLRPRPVWEDRPRGGRAEEAGAGGVDPWVEVGADVVWV
jgi:hypothetical protein